MLSSTPVGGCADDSQCAELHEAEVAAKEAARAPGAGPLPRFRFQCQSDSIASEKTCVMSCRQTDDSCQEGSLCVAGRCVLGPIPPPECVAPLQRFEVTATDAFTVVGAKTGYLHRRVVDEISGACTDDPTQSPLTVGRFHRDEPVCDSDGLLDQTPNPCSLTLDEPIGTSINPASRTSHGIRFRSEGITFELADVLIPAPGGSALYSPVPAGYRFLLFVAGGFLPRETSRRSGTSLQAAVPDRIRPAPDGTLWIVDTGDEVGTTGRRGQLIHFTAGAAGVDGFRID